MKGINGVGVVIAVIIGIVLAIPISKDSPPGAADTQHFFYYLLPWPALMILAYKRVVMEPLERKIVITKGIWPIVGREEITYDDSAKILVDATQMRRSGRSYTALLHHPSKKKPILIFADGDDDQLKSIIDFAHNAGLRLQAKKGMQKLAPDWVRKIMPELHQG